MSVRFNVVAFRPQWRLARSWQPMHRVAQAPALDYEFFKTRVQPIFLKERPGHAPCAMATRNNVSCLEELAPRSDHLE